MSDRVSVVVPIYNELLGVEEHVKRSVGAVARLRDSGGIGAYEILYVDDGSNDGSALAARRAAGDNTCVRIIRYERRMGQSGALGLGIALATGDIVVTLDGDLQNAPEDIESLIYKIHAGYDAVIGWRQARIDDNAAFRKFQSAVANAMINQLIRDDHVLIHDHGCGIKAFRKAVAKELPLYGQLHRFMLVYAVLRGYRVAEVPVSHHKRVKGKSKYGVGRLKYLAIDCMSYRHLFDPRQRRLYTLPWKWLAIVTYVLAHTICASLSIPRVSRWIDWAMIAYVAVHIGWCLEIVIERCSIDKDKYRKCAYREI